MNLRKLLLPFLICAMLVLSACQGGPKAISEAATQTAEAEANGGTGSNPGDATPTVVPTGIADLTPTIDLTPTAVTTDTDETEGEKVSICHKTGSATNPFNFITIDEADVADHEAHGDLVWGVTSPIDCEGLLDVDPLTDTDELTPTVTPTLPPNVTPTVTGTPTADEDEGDGENGKVSICHRTGSEKHPYVFITVSESAQPAHEGHGDIVGVGSKADCPTTADGDKHPGKSKGGDDDDDEKGNGNGNGKDKNKDKGKDKDKGNGNGNGNGGGNGNGNGNGKKK